MQLFKKTKVVALPNSGKFVAFVRRGFRWQAVDKGTPGKFWWTSERTVRDFCRFDTAVDAALGIEAALSYVAHPSDDEIINKQLKAFK